MITMEEVERIDGKFGDAYGMEYDDCISAAEKMYEAWQELYALMERENNYSDELGSDILDWQIGNWANDAVMMLHNAELSEKCIEVNRQILTIEWSRNRQLFYENAKRDIADEYNDLGNAEKCYQLYEDYLKEDPLWGWGWIGCFRRLHDNGDDRYEKVLNELFEKVTSGVRFRDKKDLLRELGDEYQALGNSERSELLYNFIDHEKKMRHERLLASKDSENAVEQAIAEITYMSDSFPKEAFEIIIANEEKAKPYLREALQKAIQEQMNLESDYQLHFYALFLLGQFQDKESFQIITELVSLSSKVVDYLIGDTITSGLSDILYNTYDGNIHHLKQMIADKEIDEFVRAAVLSVMGQLYLDGEVSITDWKDYLSQIIQNAQEFDHIHNKTAELICRCHFVDMLPKIRYMLDYHLMEKGYLGNYDACVDMMFEYSEDRICEKPMDAAEYIQSWDMFADDKEEKLDFEKIIEAMIENEEVQENKIGRNDPCPCGSGRKYKHCCLRKPKAPIDKIEAPEERRKWLKRYPAVGVERKQGRVYLEDYYDKESIEIDQLLYLGLMKRPKLIWNRDEQKEDWRTKEYLTLAFQKTVEMTNQENTMTMAEFDQKHSIHYQCEEWIERLLELLKDDDRKKYNEVKDWIKTMKK